MLELLSKSQMGHFSETVLRGFHAIKAGTCPTAKTEETPPLWTVVFSWQKRPQQFGGLLPPWRMFADKYGVLEEGVVSALEQEGMVGWRGTLRFLRRRSADLQKIAIENLGELPSARFAKLSILFHVVFEIYKCTQCNHKPYTLLHTTIYIESDAPFTHHRNRLIHNSPQKTSR